MSLYNLGIRSGAVVVHPILTNVSDRALAVWDGASMVRTAEGRFYSRGLGNPQVGAETPGVLGSAVDAFVGLILDAAHVMLLLGGMLLLWKGLVG